MVERLIQHCYAIDYSDSKAIQDDWKESHYIPELQIHSRMYAIADRYSIEDLRKEAKLKFHYAIHRDSDEYDNDDEYDHEYDHDDEYEDNGIAARHDVLKVLPHVYNSTPSSAHGLRTIVFSFALDHWEWFEQQSEVLKNAPREFLVDIDHAIGHLTMDKPAWLRDVLET